MQKMNIKGIANICFVFVLMIIGTGFSNSTAALADNDQFNASLEEKDNAEKLPLLATHARQMRFVNLSDFEKYSETYLNLAKKLNEPDHIFNGHYLMALVCYQKHDLQMAQSYADTAFDMSITKDIDLWYAKSLYLQALFSEHKFNLEDALIQLDAVEKIFKNSGNDEYIAEVYLLRARIAEHQNKIELSRKHFSLAKRKAAKVLDSVNLLPYRKYYADFQLRRGNFVKALTNYSSILQFEKQNNLDFASASTLVGIAKVYLSLDECNIAKEKLEQAFILSMSSGNKIAKADASKYLGNCKTKQGQLKEATDSYRKALKIYEEIGHKLGQGRVINNLGVVAAQKKDYQLAKSHFNKAMEIYSRFPFLYSRSKTLRNLGKLGLETNDIESGIDYLEQSNELAQKGSYTEVLQMNYLTLSNFYKNQNNYRKALEYQAKIDTLKDASAQNFYQKLIDIQESYDRELSRLDYQTKNQEFKSRKTLENKTRTIKLLTLSLIVLFLIFLILILLIYRQSRRKNKALDKQLKGQQQSFEQKKKDIRIAQYTFNNLGDAVMWVRKDMTLLYLNKIAKDYSTKERIDTINDILPDIDFNKWNKLWKELETSHPFIVKEFTIRLDKKLIPTEASFNMFTFEGASFVAILLKDITYRKRTEKSLREAKERAEESDRLKTRFIANMSHEIRTPLNAIDGFTSELIETDDQQEREHYIDMINKSSKRLINLINNIIDISQIEAQNIKINIELIDLRQLLNELSSVYEQEIKSAGKKIKLIQDYPEGLSPVKVYADLNKYYQVLNNLLNNALKFTKEGEIRIGYKILDSDLVEVFVADTGVGIKKDQQKEIFNVFSQADSSDTRPFQGSGLGLSISQRLMDLMHGSLSFSSEEGKGSVFSTKLKCHNEERDSEKKEIQKDIGGMKMFILSDSSTSSSFLRAILKKKNVEVESFNSFKNVLSALENASPDALLIGKSTVQYGEKQLCGLIKKSNSKVKLVLMSEGNSNENGNQYDAIIEPHYSKEQIYKAIASAFTE